MIGGLCSSSRRVSVDARLVKGLYNPKANILSTSAEVCLAECTARVQRSDGKSERCLLQHL